MILSLVIFSLVAEARQNRHSHVNVTCSDPSNLDRPGAQPLEERLGKFAQENNFGPNVRVVCMSCYRSPQHQAVLFNACEQRRGVGNCGGFVARPGQSQHQKREIATCDLTGIPDQSQEVRTRMCTKLRELCDKEFGGLCGIGGYPSGSYHFGVGAPQFSAWNQCGFLTGQPSRASDTDRRRVASETEALRAQLGADPAAMPPPPPGSTPEQVQQHQDNWERQVLEQGRRQLQEQPNSSSSQELMRLMQIMQMSIPLIQQNQQQNQTQTPAPAPAAPAPKKPQSGPMPK